MDAVKAERRVLDALHYTGRKLDDFLHEQVADAQAEQREREAGIERLRQQATRLDQTRERRMAELAEVGITPVGLEVVGRIDAERAQLATRIEDAEAVLAEWAESIDLEVVRGLYAEVLDFARGRVENVGEPAELATALRTLLDGGVQLGHMEGQTIAAASVRLVEIGPERRESVLNRRVRRGSDPAAAGHSRSGQSGLALLRLG